VWCEQDSPTPNGERLPLHEERLEAAGKFDGIGWHTFRHYASKEKDTSVLFIPGVNMGQPSRKRTIFGAPCKGTVFQRVRTPPGNSRSSR
jgi:hypothetical protein